MIGDATAVRHLHHGRTMDQGMAEAARQLRQLAESNASHQHAQMLSAIAELIDALLVDGATRH